MTAHSLQNDIMTHHGRVAGGRHGISLLAPNTIGQAYNIIALLRDIQMDAWLQAIMLT